MSDPKKAITWSSLDWRYAPTRLQANLRRLNGCCPKIWIYLTGIGIGSVLLSVKAAGNAANAETEIAFRKSQLSKEVYELKGDNAWNFPWNKDNLQEWLYRPIQITGRPIHSDTMLVHRKVAKYDGSDYIVPLVTKEDEDGSNRSGILFNKGWIPHEFEPISARWKLENARPQTFTCYLSLQSELDEKNTFFKPGNEPIVGRNRWGHVYLPDMAHFTGFKNEDKVKLALLERVDLHTPLDERDAKHWDASLGQDEDYPYSKTRAGALQLRKMPWDYKQESKCYASLGLLTTGFGLALRFLV